MRLRSVGWLLVGCVGSACSRSHTAVLVDRPANGRAQACPENPVAWGGRAENMTPDSVRCSYADANGEAMTRVSGRVMAEAKPGHPGYPAPDLMVTVHELADGPALASRGGKMVAKARTDAQGRFSLSAALPGERYLLVVRDTLDGPAISARPVLVGGSAAVARREISDVLLVLPVDDRLRGEREPGLPPTAQKPDPVPITHEPAGHKEPDVPPAGPKSDGPKPLDIGTSRPGSE